MIAEYSPGAFCQTELQYNHADGERVLTEVVSYLIGVQSSISGASEWDRLTKWADNVTPSDYVAVGVKGFGLAGFQYLRMLFGAQTTKPDVHVIRFVSALVGESVSDIQALNLLERASRSAGLPLREVDNAIWELGARGQPINFVSCTVSLNRQ